MFFIEKDQEEDEKSTENSIAAHMYVNSNLDLRIRLK